MIDWLIDLARCDRRLVTNVASYAFPRLKPYSAAPDLVSTEAMWKGILGLREVKEKAGSGKTLNFLVGYWIWRTVRYGIQNRNNRGSRYGIVVKKERKWGIRSSPSRPSYLLTSNAIHSQWIVFTWRHGGHIDFPKQWNSGHVGVPRHPRLN